MKYALEEENKFAINTYYKQKNNQQNIINFDNFVPNFVEYMKNEGCDFNMTQTKIIHPDGRIEYNRNFGFSKNKPRKIVRTYTETKREKRKDYEIQSETKYFKTGIIFKDKHYYETQKVIPKDYYVRFERTVNEYSYGTKNYGEWREIS